MSYQVSVRKLLSPGEAEKFVRTNGFDACSARVAVCGRMVAVIVDNNSAGRVGDELIAHRCPHDVFYWNIPILNVADRHPFDGIVFNFFENAFNDFPAALADCFQQTLYRLETFSQCLAYLQSRNVVNVTASCEVSRNYGAKSFEIDFILTDAAQPNVEVAIEMKTFFQWTDDKGVLKDFEALHSYLSVVNTHRGYWVILCTSGTTTTDIIKKFAKIAYNLKNNAKAEKKKRTKILFDELGFQHVGRTLVNHNLCFEVFHVRLRR